MKDSRKTLSAWLEEKSKQVEEIADAAETDPKSAEGLSKADRDTKVEKPQEAEAKAPEAPEDKPVHEAMNDAVAGLMDDAPKFGKPNKDGFTSARLPKGATLANAEAVADSASQVPGVKDVMRTIEDGVFVVTARIG